MSYADYPITYRQQECQRILRAVIAGDSAYIVGLSGAGKSNLFGFLAERHAPDEARLVYVDLNRLIDSSPNAIFSVIRESLGERGLDDDFRAADGAIKRGIEALGANGRLALLMDTGLLASKFDAVNDKQDNTIYRNLRALRDANKNRLSLVLAARLPLPERSELSELFLANTFWLGPLNKDDAAWTIQHYAKRYNLILSALIESKIIAFTGGYPSFIRAVCEAWRTAKSPIDQALIDHPVVAARLTEFWNEQPTTAELKASGIENAPILRVKPKIFVERNTAWLF